MTTRRSTADTVIADQFLAAELDEVETLKERGEKVDRNCMEECDSVHSFTFGISDRFISSDILCKVVHSVLEIYAININIPAVFVYVTGALGITAGAHRLWAHRAYKAKLSYRILVMIMNCTAFQWTDTHADPHNTNRGFFFAHMGWLMVKKHPQIKDQGKKLDLSDLFSDPVCTFQRKYYLILTIIFCFLLPTAIPVRFWGESVFTAFYSAGLFRYCFLLHATWFINSVAHMYVCQ
uniref:G protein-coupled receptor n=1 Tax=Heterorhabditis bacteriophora TaxID=37862 RepID=A0A1I7WRW2_HETBA